jgi:hypothetical protein
MALLICYSVWRHKTSSSTTRDSIGGKRKRASGNNSKYLRPIQRSDQKLWPFSAVIPVWHHKTSSSTIRDYIGSKRKRASGNYCKYLSAIQQSDQKLWPFQLLFRSGATRHPLQLGVIQYLVQGNGPPETTVNI